MEDNVSTSVNCMNCPKSSMCFQKLVPSELQFISQNKTQLSYQKGENLCKQGAFASYVMYITEGLIKIYLETSNRKRINVKILKAADFIGLPSVYGNNIYICSAKALKESTVCLIDKESFKQLIKNNGEFASEIIKWHCNHEIQSYDYIKSIVSKQMYGRLAYALLYLTSEQFKDVDIFSHITRKDIAEFAGLSTESVVRLLHELKNDKVIEVEGKIINVINPELLKKISIQG